MEFSPIKKGFFTCTNCKLKVGLSIQLDKEKGGSSPQINKEKVTEDKSKELKKEEPEKKSSPSIESKTVEESTE